MLLHRHSPTLHLIHITRRIVRIRPPLGPRKRMRPRPKSQVRLPPPVFQIVPRFKSWLRPIRNLIVMIPRRPQGFLRHLIKLRHLIFARHRPRVVPPPTLQQLFAQPAPPIPLPHVNRNMLRCQPTQFIQRLPPTLLSLVRQSRDQIKTDVSNPRLAQNRHRPVNIPPPMHPPRRHKFLVRKRLQPKTNPVNPCLHPSRCFPHLHRLRVRLQRYLFKPRSVGPAWSPPRASRGGGPLPKRPPNRIQNILQMSGIQHTRCPAANINRVKHVLVAQPFLAVLLFQEVFSQPPSSCRKQLPMPPNLPTNRLNIRRKPAASHHARMKITISTLRLTERHLHVNPELPHHPKNSSTPPPLHPLLIPTRGHFE